ncbi:hypothetical protein FHX42_004299 [Saccharopolyspora lacisalsi]|uniref:Uncharacterized protein n=1 Tax=Halosaccharopolyspora lacisalsi TaxID=1000566 RepID=A0A839E1F7_9PSEU|nr:hypothetical protein [Halosaccharopolyspora lacisalsi]
MPGSALEQLVTRLRGVLESLDAVTTTVGLARDRSGAARDVVVQATYGTEDAELVEGIEGMARTVLDLEREIERPGVARDVIERYLASLGFDGRSASESASDVDRSEVRPEFGSPGVAHRRRRADLPGGGCPRHHRHRLRRPRQRSRLRTQWTRPTRSSCEPAFARYSTVSQRW